MQIFYRYVQAIRSVFRWTRQKKRQKRGIAQKYGLGEGVVHGGHEADHTRHEHATYPAARPLAAER